MCVQLVPAHHLGDALRRAGVDREQATRPFVLEVGLLDLLAFDPHVDARRDNLDVNRPARVADRVERSVDARLDVLLAGSRDEDEDVAAAHQADDAGAELEARLVEILADVGEPLVRLAAVGVVRHDRDAALERHLGRPVERRRVDDRQRDPRGARVDRRLIAFTISPTSLLTEPVQTDVAPSSAHASWLPFIAGTKNGLVSAWLMKTKRHRGCGCGNCPSAAAEAPAGNAAAAARSGSEPQRLRPIDPAVMRASGG